MFILIECKPTGEIFPHFLCISTPTDGWLLISAAYDLVLFVLAMKLHVLKQLVEVEYQTVVGVAF